MVRRWVVVMATLFAFGPTIRSETAIRIVQTNDDGWAVANIRAQFDALTKAGYDVRAFSISLSDVELI